MHPVLFGFESSISKFELGSGQGQVMTEVGQYAYFPKWLEPSRLAPSVHLYLHPVAVIGGKRIVTSFDLR